MMHEVIVHTSLRQIVARNQVPDVNSAITKQGRKYGYRLQKGWLNTSGHASAGC
jgi:hypothetical protein